MIYWSPEPDPPYKDAQFDIEYESNVMILSRIKDCLSGQGDFLGLDSSQWAEAARCASDDVTLENDYYATLLICDSTYELNRLVGLALVDQVHDILDRANLDQLEAWGMAHIVRWIE